uniref:ABC transporter B family member 21-like n=1 Tax=Tanacetum cinerariifolium TaxID=118510 RepID=A0A6L2JXQ6_TANCI|nr:ABC transporter B family member 21-like [Tanacetum cinerariifolium]
MKGIEKESVPFYKLFAFADSTDYILMITGTIGAIGNGICMPIMAVIFGKLIDSFGENQNNKDVLHAVSKVSLKFVYLAIGAGVASFLQVAMWMVTGERQAARIRNLYLKNILRQDVSFFGKEMNTGEVVGRISGDTVLIQYAMGEKVAKFIQLLATFVGGFLIAFVKGWLLTLVMLISVPPLVISGGVMSKVISKMASRSQKACAKAATVVEQTTGSIRTVASFAGEKKAVADYDNSLEDAYTSSVNEGLAAGLGLGSMLSIIYFSYALAVWYGAKMILEKGYTGGTVVNVIMAVLTGSATIRNTSPCLSAFAAGRDAASKMFETINRTPEIDAYNTKGKVLSDIHGDIELKNVYFSYPTRPDEPIFSGFSLCVPRGTTAALVGQSGSGKSTVISLIERFYDPQEGVVLIDNISLKEFQLKWIRKKIGLVSQEPVLFSSSIKDNIMYGKDTASTDDFRVAIELANAATFIDKLPQGLDTMVGEHGTQLSGGQKQRIAIARAVLKDPRILLLDEATSALDAESERAVQEALDRIMVNRTTVIVAHRLSTIRNANMIAVIHHGKLVEKGTHSQLLHDPEGAYAQLIKSQNIYNDSSHEHCSGNESQRTSCEPSIDPVPYNSHHIITRLQNSVLEEEASKKPKNVPLRRLIYLNKPEIPVLIVGAIAALTNGVILPVFGRSYCFSVAGAKLIRRIRVLCFEKVINMEVSWFDKKENTSGAIGARLSVDAANVRGLVGDTLAQLVQRANAYAQMKYGKGFSVDAIKMYEEASQIASDAVGSIRTVASFCAEEKLVIEYSNKCECPKKKGIQQGLISGIGFGVSSSLLFLMYAATFYAGARLVEAEKTTFADVFRVFYVMTLAAFAVSQSSSFAPDTGKAMSSAMSVFVILDRKSEIDPNDESGITLDTFKGEIDFHHVSFKYPTRPDVEIFRDLCLTIQSGKTVALVGESGSGKSTVISLVQRFYNPNSGSITVDGIELQKFQLKWLRLQMGLVSQEPVLFNDTIRANISYGKDGQASETEIIAASELANAHEFICGFHQGYDTVVGERGIQLSGGQKQRVAIARAIVKSPKILLLDEATSALDAKSERVVQDALDKVMVNRTTVVVAHRLSTIKGTDVIVVIKSGVVVEKGKHEDLINIKEGFYASLVALHMSSDM